MTMFISSLRAYVRRVLADVPWSHWTAMGLLSLALVVFLLFRKRHSAYGTICLGLTVFISLFLLDIAVFGRLNNTMHPNTMFSLAAEYHRLFHGGVLRWTEMLANVAIFVPFGFFLSEFLSTTKLFTPRLLLARVALAAFGLSLCIESFQLVFRLGVCEITDLVMNTLGGFVGASLAIVGRMFCRRGKKISR